jgi:hypothetical protein
LSCHKIPQDMRNLCTCLDPYSPAVYPYNSVEAAQAKLSESRGSSSMNAVGDKVLNFNIVVGAVARSHNTRLCT